MGLGWNKPCICIIKITSLFLINFFVVYSITPPCLDGGVLMRIEISFSNKDKKRVSFVFNVVFLVLLIESIVVIFLVPYGFVVLFVSIAVCMLVSRFIPIFGVNFKEDAIGVKGS